jgi:hypothetical protein
MLADPPAPFVLRCGLPHLQDDSQWFAGVMGAAREAFRQPDAYRQVRSVRSTQRLWGRRGAGGE